MPFSLNFFLLLFRSPLFCVVIAGALNASMAVRGEDNL